MEIPEFIKVFTIKLVCVLRIALRNAHLAEYWAHGHL